MAYGPKPVALEIRLARHISPEPNTGCWLWMGRHLPRGYGSIRLRAPRKMVLVHRVMWELTQGPIPPGMIVCHHCDTPACINPAHLFLGTHGDNMQDAARKGRVRWGANGVGKPVLPCRPEVPPCA